MATSSPRLSRTQLLRVLGLGVDANQAEISRAARRLRARLESRRAGLTAQAQAALDEELADLAASLSHWYTPIHGRSPSTRRHRADEPRSLLRILGIGRGAAIAIVAMLMGASFFAGLRWRAAEGRVAIEAAGPAPARLLVESRPSDATLRVRAAGDEALLFKVPGAGAHVELAAGEYEIEVSRPDCPDAWTRKIALESGETRHYEPTICQGTGELVVRSNVALDRLVIDELDLGSTRAEPHLLGVGDHSIRVEKPGFATFVGRVRIRPEERQALRAELVPEAGGRGSAKSAAAPLPFDVIPPTPAPATAPSPTVATERSGARASAFAGEATATGPPIGDEARPGAEPLFDLTDLGGVHARGGSTTWHDAIKSELLRQFDADGSGRLDRADEVASIPCARWRAIERSFDEGRLGISMTHLYGFDGSEWHPDALGFAREQRATAFDRMKGCGLAD